MDKDYSREIYDKFFSEKGRILKITLADDSVIEGMLVGFFHGDEESHEPFITKWHFVAENELGKNNKFEEGKGKVIYQKDIKRIEFK